MKRTLIFFSILLALGIIGYSQQKIDIAKISAAASGPQTSANSDSVTQCTSCTWAVSAASGAFAAGSLNSAIPDPCFYTAKSFAVVNISSATTTNVITASSSNKNYICGVILDASAADNVALVESATTACPSAITGMSGGNTSGTGWNLAANQGFTFGNGLGTIAKSASTNVYTCLITSSTAQLSGTVSYVQVP